MAVKAALVLLAGWAAIVLVGADANTMAEMGPDAAPAPRWQSAVEVEQEEARPRAHSNSAAASREPSEIAENTVSADTPAHTPPNTDQDASEPSQPTEEPAGAESESAAAESQAQAHQQAAQPESQSAPDPEQEAPRTDDEAREDGDSSTQTTYTWRDGEHSRTVTYQAELTVVTSREGESEIVPRQAASAQSDGPPVFRSDTGELMTLPGGVLLVLDADSDQSTIDQFFAVNGISRGRVHDQTFTTNAFLVDTEPGLPSLNLAIQLAGQEGVVIASPNWEREATPQASDSLMPLLEPRSVEALADCAEIDRSAGIDDPYYGCQWHLKNTGQFRDSPTSMPDIRVEDVWDASDPETMGEGIRVAVVDSGMHSAHEDLSMNVDTSRNHNYRNGDTNISGSRAGHGTSVAGIIAARDNSVGVRGVAPRATIYGYNLLAGSTVPDANVADAMTRDLADTAVSNNSWGPGRAGNPVRAHATWEAAVVNGVENGFGGKGVVYVWAGGNGYRESDHANLGGLANHYAVTAVCAVNYKDVRSYYSELGANLWVCGLSGNVSYGRRNYAYNPDANLPPITTTDNGNRYRETFSGTSAAAPIVSGVVALMRAANDQLTWRDVKVILANSARKNDPGNSGWLSGAAKYRSPMESYSYNLAYGFGVVDAKAAVDLAKTWTNLPPWRTTSDDSTDQAKVIPDAPSNSVPGSTIESTLTVDDYVRFVEFVEINVNMVHSQFKDLAIELVSPSGNVSTLTTARRKAGSAGINGSYRFGSARHLGESPAGTWKLRVTDRRAGNSGTLRSWNVTVYGHGPTLTLSLPTPGDQSITAHWMAPDDQGGSDITSYDLRFIRSDASDKSDLRWTTRTDIATDTYEITGLEAGVYYDIQVRAHNDPGAGSWTITVQGSTSPVAPETLAAPNVSGRAGELRVSWTPPRAGQVGILRYGLRYILSSATAEEKEDGDNWTEEVAWTTGGGELKHIIDGLTNGVSYDVQARAVNSQGTSEWSSTSAGAPFIANAEPAFPMSETGIRSVSENTPAGQNIGAAIRAIDPNGDNLTYESASLDFKHFAIDESSGQIQTKKPLNHEDKSSYTFAVSVSDQKDVNAEADTTSDDTIMVTVTIEDVNEPPVVTGDMEHDITENSGRYVADFNATDPENDVLEWRLSGPDADHFEVSDSGALSFVANPDYDAFADADTDSAYEVSVEAYEVPVEASDGSLAGRIEVTINILDVNEPLVAEDDSVTVVEDTRTYLNVLANDNDPESADLTVTAPASTDNASLVVQPGGLIRYSPNPNFDKQDRFTYQISDGTDRASATVIVTIEPVNDAPVFPAGAMQLEVAKDAQEGDKVGQPVTATDVEGGPLTYRLIGNNFPFEIDTSSGQILVGPGASFDPTVQDTYTVAVRARDPGFAKSDILVIITVVDQGVNEAPVASDDAATTREDEAVVVRVLDNDRDPENDDLAVIRVTAPQNGAAEVDAGGETITYTPRADYHGADSFTYTVSDGHLDGQAEVSVTIRSVNDAPAFAAVPAERSVSENAPGAKVGVPVIATDVDDITLTYRLQGAPEFEIVEDTGQIQVAPGVTLDREHTSSYEVTVTASDRLNESDSITVTINVSNVNEAPTAVNDTATTDEDQSVRIDVLANDTDPDTERAALTVSVLRDPLDGTARVESDRTITYTPNANFAGENSFTYRLSDGSLSDDGSVTVTVEAVNDAPAFPAATAERSVSENASPRAKVGVPVIATDVDGDLLGYRLQGAPEFEIDEDTGQIQVAPGVTLDRERTPSYEVTVTASDGKGGTDSITVTINVSNVNEAPTAVNDTATTDEDQSVRIDVLDNDTDPDTERAALTVSVLRDPLDGTARVESDRTITYTPNANFAGENSFTYRLSDGSLSDDGSVTVTVEAVNDAPAFPAVPAERSVSENALPGAKVGVPVIATDVDGDLLGYRLQGAPEFEIDEDTGQIQVAPGVTLDRERTPSYEVTVTASDGKGGTDSITVTINVSNVNEAPTAVNDTATTDEDQSVRIDVLANDTDPDTERAALTVSVGRQPLNGTASVESDRTITYTPNANFAGENSFTYSVSDGSLSDAGSVTVTVEAVNDAPTFPSPTAARSVPEDAEADDNVGAPVTAMDVESALLTYSLSGADSGSFNIDSNGQITVGMGVTFDAATKDTYTVTVTADDGSGEANATATVEVTITVTAGPPIIIITGGGGGGGGGGGPSPSEVDFEWTVQHDIEQLDGGNDRATGVWSDGTTLWVADNADGAGDAVYAYDRESGERLSEREFTLAEANRAPRGFWSDRSVVWVSDSGRERLFAYRLADGERLEEREFALAAGNSDARGIWSDEETMWVLDGRADALFAYGFESGELLAEYALDSANDDPRGIWSDGVTIWVSDHGAKRLIAYRLPVLPDAETDPGEEDADDDARELERVSDEEFTELSKASNNSPRGIWSDGEVMYVADESDDRVYSYNMPDAIDARLASLTLSGVDIGAFSSSNTEYEAVVADGVTETTVEAEAMQRRTDVAIDPPDADGEADGHQVALQDLGEIAVTVTSADGSRTRVYRVQFPETGWDPARDPWPHCLRGAISEGFSLVVYEGGSVDELVGCAESRGIVALYALHEGAYVSHILGAPDFVNAGFLELFPDGLPPITPLIAGSNGPPSADPFGDLDDGGQQPWPECLRGDIAAGFSLVVSEGGSVDELEACARSADITALYTLSEGEFVSYILGAPAFVTQPFRDLFADGLPLMTPLVARSEGQPGGR